MPRASFSVPAHRLLPCVLVLAALLAMALVYHGDEALYHWILDRWGDYPDDIPFTDLHAVLLQMECHRAGVAVAGALQAGKACGVFNYSPFLLRLSVLRIDPQLSYVLGPVLACVFACSLAALPFRRKRGDVICMMLAVLSGMTVWAVTSANVDLIILELALLVSALVRASGAWRYAGYGIAILAGLIKYYPVILMGHALKERPGVFLRLFLLSIAAAALFLAVFHDELRTSMHLLPTGTPLRGWWGGKVLPQGLYGLATGVRPETGGVLANPATAAGFLVLTALALAVAFRLGRDPRLSPAVAALPSWPRSLLVSGALLIAGCFFAWQNLPYRGAFFLLVLPAALMLRDAVPGRSSPFRSLPALILFLMWQGPLSQAVLRGMIELEFSRLATVVVQLLVWAITQAVWWWVIMVLGALLLAYARESAALSRLIPCRTR